MPISGGGFVIKMTCVELWVDPGRPVSVARNLRLSLWGRMRPGPKGCRNGKGLDSLVLPPGMLVAAPVKFAMVQSADRHGEFVADLASHRPLFCELDVVGI